VDDFVLSSANFALSFTGRWDFAFQLLLAPNFSFRALRLDLEATACGAAFAAVQRAGNWIETLSCMVQLSQMGSEIVSVTSLTAIADACGDRGKWVKALETFKVLGTLKSKMDTLCLGPLLSAVGCSRQWQMAPAILWEGRSASLMMNKIVRRIALEVAGQDSWTWALRLLDAPLGKNADADLAAMNAAAALLSSSSCWTGATKLLEKACPLPEAREKLQPGRLMEKRTLETVRDEQLSLEPDDIAAYGLLLTECEQNCLAAKEAELVADLAEVVQDQSRDHPLQASRFRNENGRAAATA